MKARISITLKKGVLDPQGNAIHHALKALDFEGVEKVRQGKIIDIELAEKNKEKARISLEAMCEKLLANLVIEDYAINFIDV